MYTSRCDNTSEIKETLTDTVSHGSITLITVTHQDFFYYFYSLSKVRQFGTFKDFLSFSSPRFSKLWKLSKNNAQIPSKMEAREPRRWHEKMFFLFFMYVYELQYSK